MDMASTISGDLQALTDAIEVSPNRWRDWCATPATSGGSDTGAVSYVVTNGTATGCAVSGSTLTSSSVGTCFVTATDPLGL